MECRNGLKIKKQCDLVILDGEMERDTEGFRNRERKTNGDQRKKKTEDNE